MTIGFPSWNLVYPMMLVWSVAVSLEIHLRNYFVRNKKNKKIKLNQYKNNYLKYAQKKVPDRRRGRLMRKEKEPPQQKKESRSLSVVTSGVTTPKSFLLLLEGAMRPSLNDALSNLSSCSNRLFY